MEQSSLGLEHAKAGIMPSASDSSPDTSAAIASQGIFMLGDLSATFAFLYLLGIYSGVYVITTYIYLKGHASFFQKALVIGTITALYSVLAFLDCLNWFSFSMTFRSRHYSRAAIVNDLASGDYSRGISILVIILEYVSLVLSDVLMLWRCFHACGRSFRRFSLPLGFFVAEFILIIGQISLILIGIRNPRQRLNQEDIIAAAIFGAVAATSITSTFTICRTIYSSSAPKGPFRARYKYIADIIIQSSAIYSLIMLLLFIFELLDLLRFTVDIQIAQIFVVDAAFGMTGFLPTLMVARLAIGSQRENTELLSEDQPSAGEQSLCDTESGK